jgi:hypothetical protein
MMRRYRLGRLVRARRLRRATLQSERDLVLARIAGILQTVDRFSQMLAALQSGQRAAAIEPGGKPAEGFSAGATGHEVETETHAGAASRWDGGSSAEG